MPSRRGSIPQLRRRRLGVIHLVFFTVAASAPLTVLGGGVTTTFAVTGNAGVPLSFLVLAVALALFAVGYAAMSRHVANAGAFYSYLARGLGRPAAVAGAFVALLSYNAIQIGLYGLFGAAFGDFVDATFGLDLAWWVWALPRWSLVGVLGLLPRRPQRERARRAAGAGVHRRAALRRRGVRQPGRRGVAVGARCRPRRCSCQGSGAVFAFGIAAFIGFESGAIYSEECRDPRRHGRPSHVRRARFHRRCSTPSSSWAMIVTVGPGELAAGGHRARSRAWCSGRWPRTGATASPISPTCCSSPASSLRC